VAWRAFHLRQRLVLAQLLVQYFCLPDSGMNIRPQPGHSCMGARLTIAWARCTYAVATRLGDAAEPATFYSVVRRSSTSSLADD